MYLKYKDFIGELVYYEKLTDGSNMIKVLLEKPNGEEFAFTCKESEITIPNVMGNSRILYDIEKQKEEGGEEDD